ncbi:MAG: hypothetical protein HY040_04510 [Planctomycetes bacterium]|nr:hypothetical protein [Planctomycetota bacterium]
MRTAVLLALLIVFECPRLAPAQALPGTKPLELKGDLARVMLDGIDKYLTRVTQEAAVKRKEYWKPDYSTPAAYHKSVESNRDRLARILGVVDKRVGATALELVGTLERGSLVAETKAYKVYAVRWPVLPGVHGEGLLLVPTGQIQANVIVIPDADQTPEAYAGLVAESSELGYYGRQLAQHGVRVLIMTVVNRADDWSGNPASKRFTNQTHREFVYRMAYEMGRHVIGYEIQRILAAVDLFAQGEKHAPVGVFGYGEGGMLALYAAALDTRIQSTVVSGCFGPRSELWKEPIYRNVWGRLKHFDDGELLRLITPRSLIVEHSNWPAANAPPARPGRAGAAPGTLATPEFGSVANLIDGVMQTMPDKNAFPRLGISLQFGAWNQPGKESYRGPGSSKAVTLLAEALHTKFQDDKALLEWTQKPNLPDPAPRQKSQFDELVDFTQKLLPASVQKRQDFFWSKLDTSSLEKFQKSQEPLRDYFHREIIGKLPEPSVPLNPRTRLIYDTPKWKGYEVVLDVYEDVISYGILLVPNDIKPGEKRPCVVCQHGLEGRPTDVVNPKETTKYYNSFGAKLADLGFVVFAPQNPYIFGNDFRQVVRKANPLELTLYAFIYRQHQRILEFLGTLPFVDSSRIAYYGLSYGGKVAMRIPALLMGYCLSICSGDFNEWIWKNITLDWVNSYMFTIEYEMYEFDLGNTFNYAEMAALIAPRPFMVERGHNDGVGLDEYVAFEYAKVRRLYAKLGIPERTEIEFFQGGHEINLRGTLAFLRRHLNWPAK